MKREIKLLAAAAVMLCVVFALVPVIEQPKLNPVSVTVYEKSTAAVTTKTFTEPNNEISGKVNINSASAEQLSLLPGIGQVKAKAIVTYRQEHGKFTSPDELINVKGIGEKTLEKILPYLIVN